MSQLATTPSPPYYVVTFTSKRTDNNIGYADMADKMFKLVAQQSGFLGIESAREELGITLSYWQDIESIKAWKKNSEHLLAQQKGRANWYQQFKVRIAKVERDYEFVR